jgi:hypothetical protein
VHVQLGSLTFHGGDLPGSTGFTVSSISGWASGPAVKRDHIARPLRPGSFRMPSQPADHSVIWRGRYYGSSLADVIEAGRDLSGLAGLGDAVRLTVDWEGVLWSDVHVDMVRYDPAGAFPWADYQVEAWLPDPAKYGEVRSWIVPANQVSSMHHDGNFSASPRFVVAGPQPAGYSITATSKPSFQVNTPLPSGSTDVVDFATGRVFRNGALLVGAVSFPRVWSVPPGVVQSWSFAGTGSGTCTAELTDTFI